MGPCMEAFTHCCKQGCIVCFAMPCAGADVYSVLGAEGPPSGRSSPVKAAKHIPYRCGQGAGQHSSDTTIVALCLLVKQHTQCVPFHNTD
jgi:hypothetical protein